MKQVAAITAFLLILTLLSGCGHKKSAQITLPPAPTIASEPGENAADVVESNLDSYKNATPIYVETGMASWYGPPYHNRRGANGEIFDMNELTAAHRTLPLNSVARVTNVKTGRSTIVRITDRGPFIEGRILDLSMAAAKKVDVWRPGVARVKLEIMHSPSQIERGGRWCVQIGGFTNVREAAKLKDRLSRRYRTAKILQFTGPTGDWIRIRVLDDERARAEEVVRDTTTPEGSIFLVRLD